MQKLHNLLVVFILLVLSPISWGQNVKLSTQDSIRLVQLPELQPSGHYWQHKSTLPLVVDNTNLPFWRGLFWQSGCSCGQASSEGYVFTYEMARERNVDASLDANRFPYSFTYNFLNEGNTVCGASWLESMDIIREAGNPALPDNNGLLTDGGMKLWLNGYDHYYSAMKNRINQVYAIHVGTPEGLERLKHYLHNHLEGASTGGMAFFYANHVDYPEVLPAGTPEAGKHLITEFSNTSHSMTIVGYNDQVRYDFNNDGVYTNHIDINNDGVVDMRDWEIGALKIANTYSGGVGGGPVNWADQGFAYVPYRILAYHNGPGIWDKAAYVVDVKEDYEPLLTAKISLTHDSRFRIKVSVGVASSAFASWPDKIEDFPHFRFQGSDLYLQGGTLEADKTLEFGLDISELLQYVEPGANRKFFLLVEEDDPDGFATGRVNSFSIIDYSQGGIEIQSSQTNVNLVQNGTTLLWLTHQPNFMRPEITTDSIPPVVLNAPYQAELEAQQGSEPFQWYPFFNYRITELNQTFNPISGSVLPNTYLNASFDFEFPFYGEKYTQATVSRLGALMFDSEASFIPYARDYSVLMRYFKSIAPMYGYHSGATIRYEGNANYASFYWTAVFAGINLEYMITLFPDGTIYIDYGNNSNPPNREWQAGITKGDQTNYQEFSWSSVTVPSNKRIILEPRPFPDGLSVSSDGIISGLLAQDYAQDSIFVKVFDNNWLSTVKGFPFEKSGMQFSDYVINTSGSVNPEYGSFSYLSLDVTNVGETDIQNIHLDLYPMDTTIMMVDDSENFALLGTGQTLNLNNAFSFVVSEYIEDETPISFVLEVQSSTVQSFDTLVFVARAPKLVLTDAHYTDGNDSIFEPGESGYLELIFRNEGGAKAYNVVAEFGTFADYLQLMGVSGNQVSVISPGEDWSVILSLQSDLTTPNPHIEWLPVSIQGDLSYGMEMEVPVGLGTASETWEGGNPIPLPWAFSGNQGWFKDTSIVFEGNLALRSGLITHNEWSSFSIACEVASSGNISFYRKVSSETNYDFLRFFIDNTEVDTWSGDQDWSQEVYPISAGHHVFEWRYTKDYSVNTGEDAAFVDWIQLPASDFLLPELWLSNLSVEKTLPPDRVETDTLFIRNVGGSILSFEANLDSSAVLASNQQPPYQLKSIDGSYLNYSPGALNTGMPIVLRLEVYNNSSDSEWLQSVRVSFPLGIHLDSATHFTGGSAGVMEWDGSNGNGTDVIWYGEDPDGWGVVKGGETASAELHLWIDPAIQNTMVLFYEVSGDSYGSAPHSFSDIIVLNNLGANDTWLTLENGFGTVLTEVDFPLLLRFNTYGIPLGDYEGSINLQTNVDTTQIPVLLHVIDPLRVDDYRQQIQIYPNPASHWVKFRVPGDGPMKVELFTSSGECVLSRETVHSEELIALDQLTSGIYWMVVSSSQARWVEKIIVIPQ